MIVFTNKTIENLPPLIYDTKSVAKTTTHTILGITIGDSLTFQNPISN